MPEPQGAVVTLSEKLYVPVKEHPDVSIMINNLILTLQARAGYYLGNLALPDVELLVTRRLAFTPSVELRVTHW